MCVFPVSLSFVWNHTGGTEWKTVNWMDRCGSDWSGPDVGTRACLDASLLPVVIGWWWRGWGKVGGGQGEGFISLKCSSCCGRWRCCHFSEKHFSEEDSIFIQTPLLCEATSSLCCYLHRKLTLTQKHRETTAKQERRSISITFDSGWFLWTVSTVPGDPHNCASAHPLEFALRILLRI